MLHIRNNLEFAFTQLLEEDYYLRHHYNETGYRTFGKLAKCILGSFSSNCSNRSDSKSTLTQINEKCYNGLTDIYIAKIGKDVKGIRLRNFKQARIHFPPYLTIEVLPTILVLSKMPPEDGSVVCLHVGVLRLGNI